MSTTITPPTRVRGARRLTAIGLVAALALAGCGSSGGSSDEEGGAKATTTTAAKTTTTEAETDDEPTDEPEEAEAADGLPTTEADAPSGDWISVRFDVAVEPEPEDYNKGSAEARLYDITPDCSGEGACSLEFDGGGPGGSFALPDVEPITGDPIALEPDGDQWASTYEYPEPIGCTNELDGPYMDTTEERTLEPVRADDGEIIGLVGTLLYTDTLTQEGRDAGCPESTEATYAYAVVIAPNDGIKAIDEYEVDGTFRQTLEVTAEEGQVNPLFEVGGISTTLPKFDVDLSGSCADGECSVKVDQLNGDGKPRQFELTSEGGRMLSGTYEETSGCSDDETGEIVFESGAYESTGGYEDLTPIWIEDGQVKAFVGRYSHTAVPTEQGKTDPSCRTTQTLESWAYLVDTSVLG